MYKKDNQAVSDDLLARMSSLDHDQRCSSADTRTMLAAALPEICRELLLWRQTARDRPFAMAMALRSEGIAMRLDEARETIRQPDPDHVALADACATLLRHSTHAAERNAAADVLAQMQRAA
ncbi:hypothetical protein [Paracoccus sp. (in: a-proteobacteria)]|uniref:hypothetical protein n=1 Tax=Paracoccus sp. TaxID=267 RepID=UPI003A8498BF